MPEYQKTTQKEKLVVLTILLSIIFIIIGALLVADGTGNNEMIGGIMIGLSIGIPLLWFIVEKLMSKKNNKVYVEG